MILNQPVDKKRVSADSSSIQEALASGFNNHGDAGESFTDEEIKQIKLRLQVKMEEREEIQKVEKDLKENKENK